MMKEQDGIGRLQKPSSRVRWLKSGEQMIQEKAALPHKKVAGEKPSSVSILRMKPRDEQSKVRGLYKTKRITNEQDVYLWE